MTEQAQDLQDASQANQSISNTPAQRSVDTRFSAETASLSPDDTPSSPSLSQSSSARMQDPAFFSHNNDDTTATIWDPASVDSQPRMLVLSGSEYLALPRAPETWLVEPLLPVGGSILLYGDPKVGKSFAALQLAAALTEGRDWLGFRCPQARKVVYIQLDTPRSLWAERVEKLTSTFPSLNSTLFADRETLQTFPFDILRDDHWILLKEAMIPLNADVVIIDTLKESHSTNENEASEMQVVIARLEAAVKPAALVLVSHARKSNPEMGYDLMNDIRGSSYLPGKMDAICRFSKSTLRVSGRAIDEQSIPIERQDDGTWLTEADPFEALGKSLLETGRSIRELARIMHEETPQKSESACRAYLRRLSEKLGPGPVYVAQVK